MASEKKYAKKNKIKTAGKVSAFFKVFSSIMLIFALALTAFFITYRPNRSAGYTPAVYEPAATAARDDSENGIIANMLTPPAMTTFLIAGIDESLLTDVLIVGCFNARALRFDLVSIPRDTFTTLSDGDINTLAEAGRKIPAGGSMKMNSVYAYAGKDLGIYYLQTQLEKLTGVKIDYYVLMDLAGFRNIVDAVGGIYLEVRPQGFYYSDPDQDLKIAIPGGYQRIDGVTAEGIVRYRDDYARADIERIEMQHTFMREFFKQSLNKETIKKNAYDIIVTLLNYTRTDLKIVEIPKYLILLKNINGDAINFHTLPGEPVYENESFYMHDVEKTEELFAGIFESPAEEEEKDDDVQELTEDDIKKYKIQVLNGSDKEGMAEEKSEILRNAGFNVINVGEYAEAKHIRTRFLIKREADIDILTSFFKNPLVEIRDIPDVFDVVIITGLSE